MSEQTSRLIIEVDPTKASIGVMNFTANIKMMRNTTDDAMEKMQHQFDASARHARKSADAMVQAYRGAHGSILALFRSPFAIAGFASTYGISTFVENIFDANKKTLAFTSTMNVLTQDSKKSRQEFDWLAKTANNLGVELQSVLVPYAKMQAASHGTEIAGQGVRNVFEAISKAAVVLHSSGHDVNLMFYAIQQMVSKGVVSMEELRRQLGEKLAGALNAAADSLGITDDKMLKLVKSGQLMTTQFLPAFSREINDRFSKGFKEASEGFQANANRMNNALFLFYEEVSRQGIVDEATKSIQHLTSILNSGELPVEEFGKAIRDVFSGLAEGIKNTSAEDIRGYFESFSNGLKSIKETMSWFAEHDQLTASLLGAYAGKSIAGGRGAIVGAVVGGLAEPMMQVQSELEQLKNLPTPDDYVAAITDGYTKEIDEDSLKRQLDNFQKIIDYTNQMKTAGNFAESVKGLNAINDSLLLAKKTSEGLPKIVEIYDGVNASANHATRPMMTLTQGFKDQVNEAIRLRDTFGDDVDVRKQLAKVQQEVNAAMAIYNDSSRTAKERQAAGYEVIERLQQEKKLREQVAREGLNHTKQTQQAYQELLLSLTKNGEQYSYNREQVRVEYLLQSNRYADLSKWQKEELMNAAKLVDIHRQDIAAQEYTRDIQYEIATMRANMTGDLGSRSEAARMQYYADVGKKKSMLEQIFGPNPNQDDPKYRQAIDEFAEYVTTRWQQSQMEMRTQMDVLVDDWSNTTKQLEEASVGWAKAASDALTDYVMTGKMDFRSLANSIIRDIIRIMIQKQIAGLLGSIGSSIGGGWGAAFSAVGSAMGGSSSTPAGRAVGGPVAGGTMYRVNETGKAEMFKPNVSGTILSANNVPQSSGPVSIQTNVKVDVNGNVESETTSEGEYEKAMELNRRITAATKQVIMQEQRPGGMLWRPN